MVLPMDAAFFDLDKTVISRSSTLALSRPLYRAGVVSRGQLLPRAYAPPLLPPPARPVRAGLAGREGLGRAACPRRLRAARLFPGGRRRGEDGAPEGRDASAH